MKYFYFISSICMPMFFQWHLHDDDTKPAVLHRCTFELNHTQRTAFCVYMQETTTQIYNKCPPRVNFPVQSGSLCSFLSSGLILIWFASNTIYYLPVEFVHKSKSGCCLTKRVQNLHCISQYCPSPAFHKTRRRPETNPAQKEPKKIFNVNTVR